MLLDRLRDRQHEDMIELQHFYFPVEVVDILRRAQDFTYLFIYLQIHLRQARPIYQIQTPI